MNTLGTAITSQFYVNPETGYADITAAWKQALADKTPMNAGSYMLYAILRGKDWRKGISPITNHNKIANGGYYNSAMYNIGYPTRIPEYFAEHVKPEALAIIKQMIPSFGLDLPSEAYCVKEAVR